MRKILFRGKGTEGEDKGKWAYGVPVTTSGGDCYIIEGVMDYGAIGYDVKMSKVASNTVGQYIGVTDRNVNKIFEGDIMRYTAYGSNYIGKVEYHNGNCGIMDEKACPFLDFAIERYGAVKVGNIYDNPELLEEAQT